MPPLRLCLLLLIAATATAGDDAGEAALKKIADRAGTASGADMPRIRADLAALRVAHPGTPTAVKAAALLRTLPSPLDALSRDSIPEEQRYAWHPKEVVAVLGDHRGRQGGTVTCVAFSSDGKRIAAGGSYHVRIWDAATMRMLSLPLSGVSATAVQFSKDGKMLAVSSAQGPVYVIDTPAGGEAKVKHTITSPSPGTYSVCWHPNNKLIAWGTYDGLVRVFDVSGAKAEDKATAMGLKKAVQAVAWSPDGKLLAGGGDDQSVRVWEVPGYKEKTRIEVPVAVSAMAFSPSGKTLAVGEADGVVKLWNSPAGAKPKIPRQAFASGKSRVYTLSFSGTGNSLAIANGEAAGRVWGVAAKPVMRHKAGDHSGAAFCAALSPDGKMLATGGDDWMVRTYDLTKARPIERFVMPGAHLSHLYAAAFSPDGTTLATGSYDKMVRTWTLTKAAPEPKLALKGESIPIYTVDYSPDGKLLAAGGAGTKVRQWEARSGKPLISLATQPSVVYQVAYSPDGKRILSISGKEVMVSDPHNGGIEHRLATHKTNVVQAAWSPDGKTVATLSGYYKYDDKGRILIEGGKYVYEDCLLRFFGMEKGDESALKHTFPTPARCITYPASGKDLLIGTGDNTLLHLKLEGGKLSESTGWKVSGVPYAFAASTDGTFVLVQHTTHGVARIERGGKAEKEWAFPESVGRMAIAPDGRHAAIGLSTGVVLIMRLETQAKK